jgi:hypothetical protein
LNEERAAEPEDIQKVKATHKSCAGCLEARDEETHRVMSTELAAEAITGARESPISSLAGAVAS